MSRKLTRTSVSFPALEDVRGAFDIESSKAMSCSSLEKLDRKGVFKGKFTCASKSDSADSSGLSSGPKSSTTGGGATPPKSSGGLSEGAKAGIGVGVGVGGAVLLAALAFLIWRRRKNQGDASTLPAEKDGAEADKAAMLGNDGQKTEMEQPPAEMALGKEAQELPAGHGNTELGRGISATAPEGVESRHEMPADEVRDNRSLDRANEPLESVEGKKSSI